MRISIRKMAVAGVLGAVSIVMGTVPWLGFIPVPTPAGSATIMHIPAVLGGIAAGPAVGMFVGLIFGLISWMRAGTALFVDPLVAIVPRLFIGVTAAYTFSALHRLGLTPALAVSAVVGTLTNTVLVLGMAVLRGYLPASAALTVGVTHGIPEIVVAGILVTVVGLGLARAGYLALARGVAGDVAGPPRASRKAV